MKLKKCPECKKYTTKEDCPDCGEKTKDSHYKQVKTYNYPEKEEKN